MILVSLSLQIPGNQLASATAPSQWQDQTVTGDLSSSLGITSWPASISCVGTTFCASVGHVQDLNHINQGFVSISNAGSEVDTKIGSFNGTFDGSDATAISCTSTTFCVAVGNTILYGSGYNAFVSNFDGTNWTDTQVGANLSPGDSARLTNVSCYSSTFCAAGGFFLDSSGGQHAFVSTFDGTNWTDTELGTSLDVGNKSALVAVSCPTATTCVAGGTYTNSQGDPLPFVSTFDGTNWTDVDDSAGFNYGDGATVSGLSCATASFCVLVGQYVDPSSNDRALVSVYDGHSWSAHAIATGFGSLSDTATSVSCPTDTFCAVGGTYTNSEHYLQAFVSTYDGANWSDSLGAQGATAQYGSTINALSCSQSGECEAVGQQFNSQNTSLVATLHGSQWTESTAGTFSASQNDVNLVAVSCPTTSNCGLVGSYQDSNTKFHSFESEGKGASWSDKEIGTNLDPVQWSWNNSVSCASATFCVAGGAAQSVLGAQVATVTVKTGSNWTQTAVGAGLNQGGNAEIYSMSCTTATFCVAGGYFSNSHSIIEPFVSIFNGTSWSDAALGGQLTHFVGGEVNSVSCTSATFCVAGGEFAISAGHAGAFVSTFNGSHWSDTQVGISFPGSESESVDSVSCTSATFCVAGGQFLNSAGHSGAFVSTFNGSHWSDTQVGTSFSGITNERVTSVSCAGMSFCVAVGAFHDSSWKSFASVFNGNNWSDVEIATLNYAGYSDVASVSCTSETFCIAGGQVGNKADISVFDGSQWTDQVLASTDSYGQINSVSCVSASYCAVGGQYQSGSATEAFAAYFDGASWSDQSVDVSRNGGGDAQISQVSCSGPVCDAVGDVSPDTQHEVAVITSHGAPPAPSAPTHFAPSAPSSPSATINGTSATVNFTPGSSGGLPTTYSVEEFANGADQGEVCDVAAATSCQVDNLMPNTNYYFAVTASNSLGHASSGVTNTVDDVVAVATTTTTTTTSTTTTTMAPAKKYTITCVKAKSIRKVNGTKPMCPPGYKKK